MLSELHVSEGNFRKDVLPNEGSWVSGLQVEGELLGCGGWSGGLLATGA